MSVYMYAYAPAGVRSRGWARAAGATSVAREEAMTMRESHDGQAADATDAEKVEGIVVQTRADLDGVPFGRARSVLAQRLADAGLEIGDEDLDALALRVAGTP
jgi:hypothetical protein